MFSARATVSTASSPILLFPPHVLLFSDPVGVNGNELHSLARALASAMPETTFSFLGNQETLASLPQGSSNLLLLPFEHRIPNAVFSAGFFEQFLAAGPQIYDRMIKSAGLMAGSPVTCVISDAFMWITESVPVNKMTSWIAFYSGFPLAMLAHAHTDLLINDYGADAGEAVLSQEFIPEFGTIRVCDLPSGIVFGDAFHVKGMSNILRHADMVIFPTMPGFPNKDSIGKARIKQELPIAPLNLLSPLPPTSDGEHCLQWLNHRRALSVVYICLDSYTTSTLPPAELVEVAHGLVDSHVPFLWSIKEEHMSCLPKRFWEQTREIGLLVCSAPQLSVLSHPAVAVFVTLSGWKDVLESITAGVPMLCRPFHDDGRMVARAVQKIWAAGVSFDGPINSWWFVRAIKSIMRESEGHMMRESVLELKNLMMEEMAPGGTLLNNFHRLVEFIRQTQKFPR